MMILFDSANGPQRSGNGSPNGQDAPAPVPLPTDALIILPVRNAVLFPGLIAPLGIGRPKSIAAVQHAVREERPIGVIMQRDAEVADPGPDDLHRIGTIANIVRYMTAPDASHHIVCQGVQRMRILDFLPGPPTLAARVLHLPEPEARGPEIEARFLHLQSQAVEALQLLPQAPQELIGAIQAATSPAQLADLDVWSWDEVVRVDLEGCWVVCPSIADCREGGSPS
jgi:ATP-dependent Lon protease